MSRKIESHINQSNVYLAGRLRLNNPIYFNDPNGDLSDAEWNNVVGKLWASPFGGSWSAVTNTIGYFGNEETANLFGSLTARGFNYAFTGNGIFIGSSESGYQFFGSGGGGTFGQSNHSKATDPEKEFKDLVAQGNYLEAAYSLIFNYPIITTKAMQDNHIIQITNDLNRFMVTNGEIKTGATQTISIPEVLFVEVLNGNIEFGTFVRALGHEFVHVDQRSGQNLVLDRNEREFFGYFHALNANYLPPISAEVRNVFEKQMMSNFNAMPQERQLQIASYFRSMFPRY